MKKMKMHTPDLVRTNLEKIQALFPQCITETRDDDTGEPLLAVDFDVLRQELSATVVPVVEEAKERYRLDWPGKQAALHTANTPIAKTLRPIRSESVDFDATQNVFIEGDNLEALKLLQETYLGAVKMIYIDPPYNTGNDFVYEDDFAESTESYLLKSNQTDEDGTRLVANTESNGRFHSDWLSMIYPRLKLARTLLRDDGVIFVSIDDNEVHNLRKVMDEIFGAGNFVAEFIWQRRASSAMSENNVSVDHEYVICYSKNILPAPFVGIKKDFNGYNNPDKDPRGDWVAGDLTVGMTAAMRPNQAYDLIDPETQNIFPFNPSRVWAYIPESMDALIKDNRVIFPKTPQKRPMLKRFRNELKSSFNPISSLINDIVGLNTEATRMLQKIFYFNIFDYSKPLSLLQLLTSQICSKDDIILDFFAGSATTAHAVMQLNAEDGGNRKFIMVQLPEVCAEKSEAFKAGYRTIADISKERIRRAGQKILAGECHAEWNKDVGFRVFKVDTSNMTDVYYTPDSAAQGKLGFFADNVKSGRSAEDLLFQVMLDWGQPLSATLSSTTISGLSVYTVGNNDIAACFDDTGRIDALFAENMAPLQPLRMVFRDAGFKDSATKISVEQIFKQLSPHTEIRVI